MSAREPFARRSQIGFSSVNTSLLARTVYIIPRCTAVHQFLSFRIILFVCSFNGRNRLSNLEAPRSDNIFHSAPDCACSSQGSSELKTARKIENRAPVYNCGRFPIDTLEQWFSKYYSRPAVVGILGAHGELTKSALYRRWTHRTKINE